MDQEADLCCVYEHWMGRLVTTGNGPEETTVVSSHFRSLYISYGFFIYFWVYRTMMTIKNSSERELRSCRRRRRPVGYYKKLFEGSGACSRDDLLFDSIHCESRPLFVVTTAAAAISFVIIIARAANIKLRVPFFFWYWYFRPSWEIILLFIFKEVYSIYVYVVKASLTGRNNNTKNRNIHNEMLWEELEFGLHLCFFNSIIKQMTGFAGGWNCHSRYWG